MRTLQCPNCQKPVEWTSVFPFRPFCSERCRMIDLGAWADNRYSIPVQAAEQAQHTDGSDGMDSEPENKY